MLEEGAPPSQLHPASNAARPESVLPRMAATSANNGAAMREAYPPPPSLFNLYGPSDGVSPLPPPPPPIPTPADVAALRDRKIELKVLGNPLKLVRTQCKGWSKARACYQRMKPLLAAIPAAIPAIPAATNNL